MDEERLNKVDSEALDELLADPDLHDLEPEPKAPSVTHAELFSVALDVDAAGQIVGLSLTWNGSVVTTAEFAGRVLDEVKQQLNNSLVVHGLILSAVAAAAKAKGGA